jgi:hypothetical protein
MTRSNHARQIWIERRWLTRSNRYLGYNLDRTLVNLRSAVVLRKPWSAGRQCPHSYGEVLTGNRQIGHQTTHFSRPRRLEQHAQWGKHRGVIYRRRRAVMSIGHGARRICGVFLRRRGIPRSPIANPAWWSHEHHPRGRVKPPGTTPRMRWRWAHGSTYGGWFLATWRGRPTVRPCGMVAG